MSTRATFRSFGVLHVETRVNRTALRNFHLAVGPAFARMGVDANFNYDVGLKF